jgi:hypothetical protein
MASKSTKILLFVHHCPAQPASVLQPMDQGIIRALKQKFHRSFTLRLLQRLNSTEDGYKMSLLHAVSLLWSRIQSANILLPTVLGRQDSSQMQTLQNKMRMVMMKYSVMHGLTSKTN